MNPYVGVTSFTFAMRLMDNKDEFSWIREANFFWKGCLVLVVEHQSSFLSFVSLPGLVENMSSFQQFFITKMFSLWNLFSFFHFFFFWEKSPQRRDLIIAFSINQIGTSQECLMEQTPSKSEKENWQLN